MRFAGGQYRSHAVGYLLLAPYLGHDAPTTRPDAGGWARPRLPVIIGLSILNRLGVTALNSLTAITFDMPETARDGTETVAYSYRLNTGYAPRNYATDLAAIDVPLLAVIGADDEASYPDRLEPTLTAHTPAQVDILPDVTHLGLAAASATSEVIQRWLSNVQVNTNTTMNGSRQQPTTGTDRRVLAYETSSTMQAIGLINSPAQRRTSRREPGNADRADTTAQAR